MIRLTVNGKARELDRAMSVPEFLGSLGVEVRHFAVAVNGTVLRREELAGVVLSDGDEVELVRAVGGG